MNFTQSVIIATITLASFNVAQAACPNLEGKFMCPVTATSVRDVIISQTATADYSEYTVSDASGASDTFRANAIGIRDDFGWITRCTDKNRLESDSSQLGARAELYLDAHQNLVQTYAGKVISICSRQ